MKKIIVAVVVMLLASTWLPMVSVQAAEPTNENGFDYTQDMSGITITGYTGSEKNITIPTRIAGENVVKIETNAFVGKALTGVSFEADSQLIEIGKAAFTNNALKTIQLPKSLQILGEEAFYKNKLTTIGFQEEGSLTTIGVNAFAYNALTTVDIPKSVTDIQTLAFAFNQLTTVNFSPDTKLTTLGERSFESNLITEVHVPKTLVSIGNKAFYTNKITQIDFPADGVLETIGSLAFSINKIAQVDIPNTVKAVQTGAFQYNVLTEVTLPQNPAFISIGAAAFANNQLMAIQIPKSVTQVEDYAFNTNQLTSVTFEAGSALTSIGVHGFENNQLTAITFPETLTNISERAFQKNQLTTVDFGANPTLQNIQLYAFADNKLTSFELPKSVVSIGQYAFVLNKIKSFTVPADSALTSLGQFVFEGNPLETFEFQKAVTTVNGNVLKNLLKTGYTFEGIYENDEAFDNDFTGPLSLVIKWTPVKQAITFDPKGGSTVASVDVDYDAKLTKPTDPTKVGYVFEGWYTDSATQNAYDFDAVVTKPFTLYAKWSVKKETVTFDTKGGSVIDAVDVDYNGTLVKPTNPAKTGYVFEGWYTDEATQNAYDFNSIVTTAFTLYAKWSIEKESITFDTKGGSTVASVEVDYNTKLAQPENPTKPGYVFEGWYTDETFQTAYNFEEYVTTPLTLYAKWSPTKQTITFDTKGGSIVVGAVVDYGTKLTQPVTPTKLGYTFEGWYTDEATQNVYDFNVVVTNSMTLYAKWSIEKEVVTFDTKGGAALAPVAVDYNTTLATPTIPTKTGYTFIGWYKDSATQKAYDFDTLVTKPMTLYAKWMPTPQVITFYTKCGIVVPSVLVSYDEKLTKPTDPTRENYEFMGWYTDEAMQNAYDFNSVVQSSLILYAKWQEKELPKTETPTVAQLTDQMKKVAGTTTANATVTIQIDQNLYTTKANSQGVYTLNVSSLKAGQKITVTAIAMNHAVSEAVVVVVKDTTPPTVKYNEISDKTKKITVQTEAKAEVSIYVNNRLLSKGTANNGGVFSTSVKNLTAGATVKVVAEDEYGNRTTKTVKVLDRTAPTVEKITAKKGSVSGKTEKNTKITIKKGSKVIKTIKTKDGKFSTKLPKGTYSMTFTDSAKNTSTAYKVTVS